MSLCGGQVEVEVEEEVEVEPATAPLELVELDVATCADAALPPLPPRSSSISFTAGFNLFCNV